MYELTAYIHVQLLSRIVFFFKFILSSSVNMFVYIFIGVCKTGGSVGASSILVPLQHFRVCP